MEFDLAGQRSEILNVHCAIQKATASGIRRACGDRRHSSRAQNRSRVRPHALLSVARCILPWLARFVMKPVLLTPRPRPATLDRAFPELSPRSPVLRLGT